MRLKGKVGIVTGGGAGNSGIIDLDKNQLLIGCRICQKSQILGFSTASLCYLKIVRPKKVRYANHLC
jgi:hypothetical protein